MLIEERRRQIEQTLGTVGDLSHDERRRIAALDLSIYESLALATLRRAHHLLERDPEFDWKTREEIWHRWRAVMLDTLEGCLRYRENETLIVVVAVCAALFPIVHHGAGLLAYKTIDDVVAASQRGGVSPKRERARQRLRTKDILTRIGVRLDPAGEISCEDDPDGGDEVAGIAVIYHDWLGVARLVDPVIAVRWRRCGDRLILVPSSA